MSKGGLAKVKSYPLSDADIRKILGDVPTVTYPELEDMSSIDQCFDEHGRCILFFPNVSATMGHWCCMIRRPKSIEFFDSYGDPPEAQKDGLSEARKEELDIDEPALMRLLRASGKPVYYNTFPFQKDRSDIATCGRHCIVRLLYAPYSLDKYASIIKKSGMSPDDFVSGVTYDKLRK
jgi:hypothetical protein